MNFSLEIGVSKCICSTSKKQVFGISVQHVDKLWQSLDFSRKISPNGLQPKIILNVVGYPEMLFNLHIHHDLDRIIGLGDVLIWESINPKYVMTPYHDWFMVSGDSSYRNTKLTCPQLKSSLTLVEPRSNTFIIIAHMVLSLLLLLLLS